MERDTIITLDGDDGTDNESLYSEGYAHDSRHCHRHRNQFQRRKASDDTSNISSNCTSGEFGKSLEDSLSADVISLLHRCPTEVADKINLQECSNSKEHTFHHPAVLAMKFTYSACESHHVEAQSVEESSDSQRISIAKGPNKSEDGFVEKNTIHISKNNIVHVDSVTNLMVKMAQSTTCCDQDTVHAPETYDNTIVAASSSSSSAPITNVTTTTTASAASGGSFLQPYSTPSHLVSYENHLSRISMYDEDDDLDEYGHYLPYDPYEDLALPRVRSGRDGRFYNNGATWMFPPGHGAGGVALSHPSGLYIDDVLLPSHEASNSTIPTPRELQQQQTATQSFASSTIATANAATVVTTSVEVTTGNNTTKLEDRRNSEVADVDCYPLTSNGVTVPMINSSGTATAANVNTTLQTTTTLSIRPMRTIDTSSTGDEEMSHHVVCMMDNHKATLFCRSFTETHHNNLISLNIPVCMGLFGWRIIQEPYCRLYSVVEYKVKIIINHQEYNVWKRYEDFVKLATSCQRLSAYYQGSSSSSSSRKHYNTTHYQKGGNHNNNSNKRRFVQDSEDSIDLSVQAGASTENAVKLKRSSWFPSCLCPTTELDVPTIASSASLTTFLVSDASTVTSSIGPQASSSPSYQVQPPPPAAAAAASSSSASSSSSSGTSMNMDDFNLQATLAMWQQVEQHRPYWWMLQPSTQSTRFACEESELLELFLQNLLYELPNMQLICEFIL